MSVEHPLRLLYVYDALCGWCYGFSDTLRAFVDQRPGTFVHVVSGGMILGERRGPIGEVAGYIKQAYKDVETRTGIRFGESFINGPLEDGSMYMSSEVPAALLAFAREEAPARQLEAANTLLRGIYYHGFGPSSDDLSLHLGKTFNIPEHIALMAKQSAAYKKQAEEDFVLVQRLGVKGFPALFVQHNAQVIPVASGFVQLEQLQERVATIEAGIYAAM